MLTYSDLGYLREQAREHGIPEEEVLAAWEEMKSKHRLPWYVEPTLETTADGSVTLSPAVNINLLSRLDREVPSWEQIRGPVWPSKKERVGQTSLEMTEAQRLFQEAFSEVKSHPKETRFKPETPAK